MTRVREVAFCSIVLLLCSVPHSAGKPVPADQQITVKHFAIEGAGALSSSQIGEVKSSVMGKPGSPEVLMDTARNLLTTFLDGYCYIRSDIQLAIVNAQATPDAAWMNATVKQGTRYRLRNFGVHWATVFSAQEIEQRLPLDAMRRGDCSGLDLVKDTITDMYQRRGFRNVKVNQLVQPSQAAEQFDLTLYIDEGK
jgi:outer membrane protein assembly factor BamA